MTAQPQIPGVGVRSKLTERQEIALEIIREHGPVNAREIGRMYREKVAWQKHPAFDEENGLQLAKELRRKGYARRRNRNADGPGGWYAVDADGKPLRPQTDAAGECCAEYPFCGCAA